MEKDLRLTILSVAVSTLLKRARVTPNQLKAEFTAYIKAMPPEFGHMTQAELDFCLETIEGLCGDLPKRGQAQ